MHMYIIPFLHLFTYIHVHRKWMSHTTIKADLDQR